MKYDFQHISQENWARTTVLDGTSDFPLTSSPWQCSNCIKSPQRICRRLLSPLTHLYMPSKSLLSRPVPREKLRCGATDWQKYVMCQMTPFVTKTASFDAGPSPMHQKWVKGCRASTLFAEHCSASRTAAAATGRSVRLGREWKKMSFGKPKFLRRG